MVSAPLGGLLLAVLLFGSACQADTRVTIAVGSAGDGAITVSVRLDKEAAGRFPDLVSLLKVADLRRAGWVISGLVPAGDGSATVRATRPFRDAAEAAVLLTQLTGSTGPLHSLSLTYHRSIASTRTKLAGAVDLRRGVDAFADSGLAAQLGYASLSGALAAVQHSGGAVPVLRFEIAAQFAGGVDRAPRARRQGKTAVWTVDLGRSVPIVAASSRRNWVNLGLLAVCAASVLGLVLIGLRRLLGLGDRRDGLQFGGDGGRRWARRHRRDSWRLAERGFRR